MSSFFKNYIFLIFSDLFILLKHFPCDLYYYTTLIHPCQLFFQLLFSNNKITNLVSDPLSSGRKQSVYFLQAVSFYMQKTSRNFLSLLDVFLIYFFISPFSNSLHYMALTGFLHQNHALCR